jgi:hypothetical protein
LGDEILRQPDLAKDYPGIYRNFNQIFGVNVSFGINLNLIQNNRYQE